MKIKALGYLLIESTKPQQWQSFMVDVVGMMIAPMMNHDEIRYFKMDAYSWRIAVKPSTRDCLSIAGWEVATADDFAQAVLELQEAGIIVRYLTDTELTERHVKQAIQFKDPANNTIEIFYHMPLDYLPLISKVGLQAFDTGFNGDMGLGHYVFSTDNFKETCDFYRRLLGFGQTDHMAFKFSEQGPLQELDFLHVNNPRHHSLAIFEDPRPPVSRCVHLMVEVPNIDDVGYFIDRCKAQNVPISSSIGKHTNDLMTSVYVKTPSGFDIEFGTGGLQLEWDGYKPTVSARPSLWGHEWNGG